MRTRLTDSEYQRFRDWLTTEYGLTFGPEKRDILRSRLEPMRVHLDVETFEEVFFHLKFHPDRAQHRQTLISHITNNESYFFRESAQLDMLRDEALPQAIGHAEARKRHTIRILSAGCASGEEPYSVAMMLRLSGRIPLGTPVQITGVDLDPEALDRARAATYTENAFRRVDPAIRKRFFTEAGNNNWQLDSSIRKMVSFHQANIAQPRWIEAFPRQDVIFCRNVLIYFDREIMQQAVASFYDALTPGGHLFLGHSESLSALPTRFEAVRRAGALFYRRPESESE